MPGLRGQQEADRQRPQPACFQMSDGRSGYPGQCNKEAKSTGQRELPPWGKNVKRNGNRKGVFVGRGGGRALRPPADALRRIRRSRSGGGEPGGSVSVLVTTPSPFYKEARYQHQAPTMCFGRTYYVPLYMCISYHSSTPPSISVPILHKRKPAGEGQPTGLRSQSLRVACLGSVPKSVPKAVRCSRLLTRN